MQLDLFASEPAADRGLSMGELVAFPAWREAGTIQRLAEALLGLRKDDGRRLWQAHCRNLRARRKSQGFPSKAIATEIEQLTMAVSSAMHSRGLRPDSARR